AWSDAKNAPFPADLMRGTMLDLDQGVYDVTLSYSHLRGGHDGVGVNMHEDQVVVHHNRIENFADDAFELEADTVKRITIYENYIANCLTAISPGQSTPVFDGPVLFYRNVVSLLRVPLINRTAGINTWNGGGRYGMEYMFKQSDGYSTRNTHYYQNTL